MIELGDVAGVREELLRPECAQALSYWNDQLEPYLGRDAWLQDDGAALAALLNCWAPESAAALVAATQRAGTDGGSALMAWLDAAALQGQSRDRDASLEDYYPEPSAWYVGEPQPVPERDGWWAAVDASGQWWAVQMDVCPDATTVGWVVYEEAFAAPAAWVAGTPSAQPAHEGAAPGAAVRGAAIGGHRAATAEPTAAAAPAPVAAPAPAPVADEPVDEDKRRVELETHNKRLLEQAKNGAELSFVIVRSPGGMLARETEGYACVIAPTAEELHSREVFFEGTLRYRQEKFSHFLDFIEVPQPFRSACACCAGWNTYYRMNFLDSSGAIITDHGAYLPYPADSGGSVARTAGTPPDFDHAALINERNLHSRHEDLQWQLGRNGLLLIGYRMLDEGSVGLPGYHSDRNLLAMGDGIPGHVVGGGRVSFREDRRGRVTAVVFHSVDAKNRDAVLQEAKNADPKMKFELLESR